MKQNLAPKILKIVPPLWLLIFLFVALVAHFYFHQSQVFHFGHPLVGVGIFLIGLELNIAASNLFNKEKTEILPTSASNRALITQGIFRFSRNPMYLGMVLVLLGAAFFFGTLPFFLAVVAQFLILNFVFIPFEEEKMARQFGEQYAAYKHKVRRWL